ncbi:MAG: hypothetical protein ABJO01_00055 [Parasphingorhabdus sp.]|uniref:hypothetical protein n=1 Tax=Parasphingorhabdus sp. TaxID=2709688 RepID=UPI0032977370
MGYSLFRIDFKCKNRRCCERNLCRYTAMMRLLFWLFFAACGFSGPVRAENSRPIVILDVTISLPVPDGYVDVSQDKKLPPENALFYTKIVEPWEKAGEFDEGILFYGLGFAPATDAIKQEKFEQIFRFTREKIEAHIQGQPYQVPATSISAELINTIYQISHGDKAGAIMVTDNRKDRKALLIDTGFVMPGVVTYPIVEEISFTRLLDRIVIFHSTRVDTSRFLQKREADDAIRADVKATGLEIRNALIKTAQ